MSIIWFSETSTPQLSQRDLGNTFPEFLHFGKICVPFILES